MTTPQTDGSPATAARSTITGSICATLLAMSLPAYPQEPAAAETSAAADRPIETVHVYGESGASNTATKLDLTLFETPQTVSVISRAQLDDFALTTVNQAMDYSPGVTVEEVETNRTYYTARGFDIVNFQYDGVGTPFTFGINLGQQDTAIYEQVEVVKGAAGLITGLANPSATINYIRKRPTDRLAASSTVTANEWDGLRIEGDVSGALTDRIRGRLVLAWEDSKSYLDRYEYEDMVAYGIVEADVTTSTLLTVGHSYDGNDSSGVLWGALPLVYTDGTPTSYDVSTSTSPDWTSADTTDNQTFVELEQRLGGDWSFNAVYTRIARDFDSSLFYVYGTPDPATEIGLFGYASGYDSEETQNIWDVYVSGRLSLGGREHELVVGYNHADIQTDEASFYDSVNGFPVLGPDWAEGNSVEPDLVENDPFNDASDIEQQQRSLYVSSRLNLSDRLSVLLGARHADVEQDGFSYGAPSNTDAEETVPYYGATFEVIDNLNVYGSFSEVFVQQTWVNEDFQPLGPTEGENAEVGLKYAVNDGRAVLTLALFRAKHENLGEFVGRDPTTGTAFYAPRDFESEGYEIEFTGQVTDGMNVSAGYTRVDIENRAGDEARPYVPKNLLKLSAGYSLPFWPALRVGGIYKWQSEVDTTHGPTGERIEQDAYGLLDLFLRYDIGDSFTASVNFANVTDEQYLNSVYWDQAYYGAPRNVQASVTWRR